jgi:hypothetical protein
MKAVTRGLMTIALFAATAACDGSPTTASAFVSENDGVSMAKADFTFTNRSSYDFATRNEQTASGGAGAIDFAGNLTTGHPCYDVSATRSVQQTQVTVTVTANDNGNTCMQVITYQNYTGRVAGLAAGTYDFTVVHVTNGTSQTAWTGPVTVQ